MSYQIKLEKFEGPLDLLLFFIRRDRLNIYDIPISDITKEFLHYISMMEMLNIDLGGEFILMASMLMKIKARMLLPVSEEEDDDVEDPRTPLVQRLMEYQQFKKAGNELLEKYDDHSRLFPKGEDMNYLEKQEDAKAFVQNVSLFQLMSIFKEMIDRLPDTTPYELQQEHIHLDEQVEYLRSKLTGSEKLLFSQLFSELKTRLRLVVTFMAVLEMLRKNELQITQDKPFGDIILTGAAA